MTINEPTTIYEKHGIEKGTIIIELIMNDGKSINFPMIDKKSTQKYVSELIRDGVFNKNLRINPNKLSLVEKIEIASEIGRKSIRIFKKFPTIKIIQELKPHVDRTNNCLTKNGQEIFFSKKSEIFMCNCFLKNPFPRARAYNINIIILVLYLILLYNIPEGYINKKLNIGLLRTEVPLVKQKPETKKTPKPKNNNKSNWLDIKWLIQNELKSLGFDFRNEMAIKRKKTSLDLISYWNELGIIKHRKGTKVFNESKGLLDKYLEDYSFNEIKKAMDLYKKALLFYEENTGINSKYIKIPLNKFIYMSDNDLFGIKKAKIKGKIQANGKHQLLEFALNSTEEEFLDLFIPIKRDKLSDYILSDFIEFSKNFGKTEKKLNIYKKLCYNIGQKLRQFVEDEKLRPEMRGTQTELFLSSYLFQTPQIQKKNFKLYWMLSDSFWFNFKQFLLDQEII